MKKKWVVLLPLALSIGMAFSVSANAEASDLFSQMTTETSSTVFDYVEDDPALDEAQSVTLPSKVDLRERGLITPVRNQGEFGTCWAFSSTGAMESALLREGLVTDNTVNYFSPKHLAWFTHNALGTNRFNQLGEGISVAMLDGSETSSTAVYDTGGDLTVEPYRTISAGEGLALESDFPYCQKDGDPSNPDFTGDWSLDESSRFVYSEYSLTEAERLPSLWVTKNNNTVYNEAALTAIKTRLNEGYALGLSYCANSMIGYKTPKVVDGETIGQYFAFSYKFENSNHGVVCVGYNDNIPAEYFQYGGRPLPAGDGGFLIKNSWGSSVLDGGYFWLSYYDTSIRTVTAYTLEENNGDDIACYNYLSIPVNNDITDTEPFQLANIFTAGEELTVDAVSYETSHPDVETTVQVLLLAEGEDTPEGSTVLAEETFTDALGGYHKHSLSNAPVIEAGRKYAIAVSERIGDTYYFPYTLVNSALTVSDTTAWVCNAVVNQGESMYRYTSDDDWNDFYINYKIFQNENISADNFPIKAFTKGTNAVAVAGVNLNKAETALTVGDTETLTAAISPANATNRNVTWSSDKETVATVNENGVVTAKAAGTAVITVTTEDGNFTASCTVTVEEPAPATGAEGFVTRLYQICLDRKPDQKGLDSWVNALKEGSETGVSTAKGFVFSDEFKNKDLCNEHFVLSLYQSFMGREADKAGLDNWVNCLETGMTREEVFNGFALSDEFKALCQSYGITVGEGIEVPQYGTVPHGSCTVNGCGKQDGVTEFVTRMYTSCLERKPDEEGLNYWCNALWDHTKSGSNLAYGFVFSPEMDKKDLSNEEFVEMLYHAFMGRDPDLTGWHNWTAVLDQETSREDVFNGFVGSAEFDNLCKKYGIVRA